MSPPARMYVPARDSNPFEAVVERARLYRLIRTYLDNQGYIEVETPVLYPRPEVAPMDQYITVPTSGDQTLFLRVCPTEHLKRLLVAGFEAVYELSRNFRPGNLSPRHLPEFTSLECTRTDSTYVDMMALTEELVASAIHARTGNTLVRWEDKETDFGPPWSRVTVRDAVMQYTGIDIDRSPDLPSLHLAIASSGLRIEPGSTYNTLLEELINEEVLPRIAGPVFLTEYPWLMGGPAKAVPDKVGYKQRCEAFIGTFELANMSTHLGDAVALRQWHETTLVDKRISGVGEATLDEYLMRDIEGGLPPSAIVGIGIDRLLMIIMGVDHIENAVAFPLPALNR